MEGGRCSVGTRQMTPAMGTTIKPCAIERSKLVLSFPPSLLFLCPLLFIFTTSHTPFGLSSLSLSLKLCFFAVSAVSSTFVFFSFKFIVLEQITSVTEPILHYQHLSGYLLQVSFCINFPCKCTPTEYNFHCICRFHASLP